MGLSAGVRLPVTGGTQPNLTGSTHPLPSSRQSVSPRSPLLTPAAELPGRRHTPKYCWLITLLFCSSSCHMMRTMCMARHHLSISDPISVATPLSTLLPRCLPPGTR